jgi:hypothetical protein
MGVLGTDGEIDRQRRRWAFPMTLDLMKQTEHIEQTEGNRGMMDDTGVSISE